MLKLQCGLQRSVGAAWKQVHSGSEFAMGGGWTTACSFLDP